MLRELWMLYQNWSERFKNLAGGLMEFCFPRVACQNFLKDWLYLLI
jgi:hypothetical protein